MIGLMLLAFIVAYLTLSIFVTKKTFGWAKANNKKPWLWGGLAAFVMYNLVFWDWIPTVVVHKYYCATQAGFFVYKTPEQWKKDNPDMTGEDLKSFGEKVSWGSGESRWRFPFREFESKSSPAHTINNRLYLDGRFDYSISRLFPVHKHTSFIADMKDDQKLAEKITFLTGYKDPMGVGGLQGFKYWLVDKSCGENYSNIAIEYSKYIDEVVGLGEEE